jgi:hypothetical protein
MTSRKATTLSEAESCRSITNCFWLMPCSCCPGCWLAVAEQAKRFSTFIECEPLQDQACLWENSCIHSLTTSWRTRKPNSATIALALSCDRFAVAQGYCLNPLCTSAHASLKPPPHRNSSWFVPSASRQATAGTTRSCETESVRIQAESGNTSEPEEPYHC